MYFQEELEMLRKREQVRYARSYYGESQDPKVFREVMEDNLRIIKRAETPSSGFFPAIYRLIQEWAESP